MSKIITKKKVNALIKDAKMGFIGEFITEITDAGSVGVVLDGAKIVNGGLWVGGTAMLFEDKFVFRSNLLNKLLHKGNYSIVIPLNQIIQVNVRFGFITKKINIQTDLGVVSIRCDGADTFAKRIQSQIEKFISVQ